MNDIDWRWLQTLLTVARVGNLSRAAAELGVSQPTLSRWLQALEHRLGTRLMLRHARGLTPTEPAKALLKELEGLDARMRAGLRRVGRNPSAVEGTVRISASEPVSAYVLPPILAALRERWPEVHIELVVDNRTRDVAVGDVDIAVRMFRPTQLGLIASHLGDLPLGLYAHPTYLQRHGTPTQADLRGHTLIGFDRDRLSLSYLQHLLDTPLPVTRESFQVRCDSMLTQTELVRQGVGIGPAHAGVFVGELVRVLAHVSLPPLSVWLVMAEDQRNTAPTHSVYRYLAAALTAHCTRVNEIASQELRDT